MRPCILMLLFPVVLMAQTGNVSNPPQAQPAPSPTQSQPAIQASPNAMQQNPQQQEATNSDQFRAEVEEGVKHMLVSQIEAWNHQKLEGLMQGNWRSPALPFFSGSSVTKAAEPTFKADRHDLHSLG